MRFKFSNFKILWGNLELLITQEETMNKMQKQVLEFHQAFGVPNFRKPTLPLLERAQDRMRLMREESKELTQALITGNMVDIADGLADLLYVTLGTAIVCGIDMEPIFDEVHRSNMTKVGGHLHKGKWMKPPTYSPPDLSPILERLKGKPERPKKCPHGQAPWRCEICC